MTRKKTNLTVQLLIAICIAMLANGTATGQSTPSQISPTHVSPSQGTPSDTHLWFFTSNGCAPCLAVKPSIARLASDGYPVSTVNIDQQPSIASRFGIDRTPTVVLVHGGKMVGRHAGMIRHGELVKWFGAVGFTPGTSARVASSDAATTPARPMGTKVVLPASSQAQSQQQAQSQRQSDFQSPTMHQGTRRPGNRAEAIAMAATVKLQVEDPEGTSYATGTVIHTHENESLVLTCGHVFRDSKGTGVITAHYGFDQPSQRTGSGELVFYDADARDIALVVIRTQGEPLTAVEVASKKTDVQRGVTAFSIGCDHGEDPTIRHTKIKNRASYDGAIKYDIYGRPVDGRSGGGLFTDDGRIIGVCNAAVVDIDEGIYTALDTIHWQLAKVQLDHLFDPDQALAIAEPSPAAPAIPNVSASLAADTPSTRAPAQFPRSPDRLGQRSGGATTLASLKGDRSASTAEFGSGISDKEVLIIVRSRDNASQSKMISIDDPSDRLVSYLENLSPEQQEVREIEIARHRARRISSLESEESGVRRPFRGHFESQLR